ncbi:hypothetical protein [Streptomyces griseoaurantiacus]|uniref:hypothetical protein n=1 Tax=Streptomyces griseoaurantiacus TaxID=68213 RepID=UPI00367D4D7B
MALTSMAAWWSLHRDGDDERLRDPDESQADRMARYRKHIAAAHGVDEAAAGGALNHVLERMGKGMGRPEDYGFSSSAHSNRSYRQHTREKLWTPDRWNDRPEAEVSLHQPLHATQHYIRPEGVAHNLFHPGSRPAEWNEGDPDYAPHRDEDLWHENDEDSGVTDDHLRMFGRTRFLQRRNRLEVVDGHHRVAADMLLGKRTTPGVVVHERDL